MHGVHPKGYLRGQIWDNENARFSQFSQNDTHGLAQEINLIILS